MAHIPVMVKEVLDALRPHPTGCYLDGTVGGGGHSAAILAASAPAGRLLGTDADPRAIQVAADRLAPFGDRVVLRQCWLDQAADVARREGFAPLDGIVVDLGVSSNQLDTPERGLSFMRDGPLDMRFDQTQGITAAQLLGECDVAALARILKAYGEVAHAWRVAEAIWAARPVTTTTQLREVVAEAAGYRARARRAIHPATQVFQALRIAVNDELRRLAEALPRLIDTLAAGGRLAVISFHSLEDRIVKTAFRAAAADADDTDTDNSGLGFGAPKRLDAARPVARVRLVNKKPAVPRDDEVRQNPRARSARLRVVERIDVD